LFSTVLFGFAETTAWGFRRGQVTGTIKIDTFQADLRSLNKDMEGHEQVIPAKHQRHMVHNGNPEIHCFVL
jgi:hypothetical protein